jgi:hypothetical protein
LGGEDAGEDEEGAKTARRISAHTDDPHADGVRRRRRRAREPNGYRMGEGKVPIV